LLMVIERYAVSASLLLLAQLRAAVIVISEAFAPPVVTFTLPEAKRLSSWPTFNTANFAVGVQTPLAHAIFFVAPEEITTAAWAVLAQTIVRALAAARRQAFLAAFDRLAENDGTAGLLQNAKSAIQPEHYNSSSPAMSIPRSKCNNIALNWVCRKAFIYI
jgi:hypothetical protein